MTGQNPLLAAFQATQKAGSSNPLLDDFTAANISSDAVSRVIGKEPEPKQKSALDRISEQRAPRTDAESRVRDNVDPDFEGQARRIRQYDRDQQDATADAREQAAKDAFRPNNEAERMGIKFWQRIRGMGAGGGRAIDATLTSLGMDPNGTASQWLKAKARSGEEYSNRQVAGETSWEVLKAAPSFENLARYTLEQGASSAADMGALASGAALPAYIGMSAGSMGQQRAENNGETDATGLDVLKALPAATLSAGLERLGEVGIFNAAAKTVLGRMAKAVGAEALTEFIQNPVEYAGSNLGTNAGFDPMEALDQGIAGAVAGGAMGGAIRAGGEIVNRGVDPHAEVRNPAYDRGVAGAALDAFRPDTKADMPLTEADRASPLPDALIQRGKNAAADALGEERPPRAAVAPQPRRITMPAVAAPFDKMVQITLGSESGNRDIDAQGRVVTSSAGARGRMQVMDGTNLDPGYGVRPAKSDSLEERARVGRDYLAAMMREYGGDPAKAWAAYNAGPGRLNNAIKQYGNDYLDHMPAETRAYVMKNLARMGGAAFHPETGELQTVETPDVPALDREDSASFIKRVLGEDFLTSQDTTAPAANPAAVAEPDAAPLPAAPASTSPGMQAFPPEMDSLGVPRSEMPQVSAEHRGAMVRFLGARGIQHTEVTIPAASLKPTQAEFDPEKVQKARDYTGGNRAILISSDGRVVDGHHQWLAALEKGEDVRAIQLNAPVSALLPLVHEFPSADVDRGDAPNPLLDEMQGGAVNKRSNGYRDRTNDTETDLLTFIAANGGLRDDEGHNLKGWRNLQRPVAGLGSLIRQDGRSIDSMRERMVESGWLPEDATEADALELIDRSAFRPVYHPQSQRFIDSQTASLEPEGEARSRISEQVDALGLEAFGEKEVAYALTNMSDGMTTREAILWALDRAISEETEGTATETAKDETYVPGFDEETDARKTKPRAAPASAEEDGQRSETVEGSTGESGGAPARLGSSARLTDTPSGKGITVSGATDEELSAIKAAIPANASGVKDRNGGWTFSKKHEEKIRSALAPAEAAPEPAPPSREGRTADAAEAKPAASAPKKEPQPLLVKGNKITLSQDIEYASAGATYSIDQVGKQDVWLVNDSTAGRTSVKKYNLARAWNNGGWNKVEPTSEGENGDFEAPKKSTKAETDNFETKSESQKRFSANKIFTEDKVAAARARLKEKLSGTTLNSGVDPELLIDGMTIAGAYIESGIRKFADVAKMLATDLEMSMSELKPYLRAWYNGARDMLEDAGQDVSDMDGPGAVRAALTMIEDAETRAGAQNQQADNTLPPAVAEKGKVATRPQQTEPSGTLQQAFSKAFDAGQAFATITEARAFAEQQTGEKIAPGSEQAKALDEAIEAAVIYSARKIAVQNEGNPQEIFRKLVDLYGRQPKLSVRTSTSIEQQAYSTPVPLAYIASQRAGINQNTTVYEPTAGNGALLIDARPSYVIANELNPDRAAALRAFLPGARITERDATDDVTKLKVDAVIANPPFGAVKDESSKTVRFDVNDRYSTNEVDHVIALKALEAMKDGGKAVLIVGGINKLVTDAKGRADAYNGKAKREFYYTLYSGYNVTDHFTVDGSLYERQGAGWPVDVIVIEGRGKSALSLPAVKAPRVYASWDALSEVLSASGTSNLANGAARASAAAEGTTERPARNDVGNSGQRAGSRADRRAGNDTAGQPAVVRDGPVSEQPGSVRMGADGARVDQAAGDQRPDGVDRSNSPRVEPEVEENERQVAYTPGSRSDAMGTLVPVNMQTAISDSLNDLESRVGDIDSFVSDRLGYGKGELYERFGAEQVDAIALAIDNMERGAGFIIGDQTGIGKGRVVAAIIRYAIRQNRAPIFVTEKPNLYADMFRDMTDIGLPEMLGRPINATMTDMSQNVPIEGSDKPLKTSAKAKHGPYLEALARDGLAKSKVDVLFTSYSQMQTVKGQETTQRTVLRALANGGIVIFDESHNAGGTAEAKKRKAKSDMPNRADFARELVKLAHGVFYSSATYAKRPDVMDLYAATDMKMAVEDVTKLGEAINKGGVPMQQVVAAMLARAGQYVRRERSFDGIAYNTPRVAIDRESYGKTAGILAAIKDFSADYVKEATAYIDEQIREEAETVGYDGAVGIAGADSVNFTSIMHNVISQMLLAFKAKDAADRAIASIKNGEKPVLTVANTLENMLNEFAEDADASPGSEMNISLADVFSRYLERSRIITIKKPFAEKGEKGRKYRLTDKDLGPAGVKAFNEARELIAAAGLDEFPGSPIDYMQGRIRDAGYSIGEITGRKLGLDYRDGTAFLKARSDGERSIKGRLKTISGFNSGQIDAILLNRSGSTGLSLHASKTFKDQKKRRMIIVQPEGNIDTHMQMLGRVHRTGQVVLPEYDQLVGEVPAEKRPAAVLAKKMASLNANTTASRDSALTSTEVLDFMNQYGDTVIARIMLDEPDIHSALGYPLGENPDPAKMSLDGVSSKVTGRIPLLPIEQQEEIYQQIEEEYAALLAQKEAAGENALEAKTIDLQARLEASAQAVPPVVGSNSPFGEGVNVDTISIKRPGKPYKAEEVLNMIAENIGETVEPTENLRRDLNGLRDKARNASNAQAIVAEGRAFIQKTVEKAKSDEAAKIKAKLEEDIKQFRSLTGAFHPGDSIRLKMDSGNFYGVITNIRRTGKAKNPVALSAWKMDIAVVDASRSFVIPFSQLMTADQKEQPGSITIEKTQMIGLYDVIHAFNEMQVESREKRAVISGNLLAGFDYVDGKGSIINFTMEDGSVRQGILMRQGFDLAKHQAAKPIQFGSPEILSQWLQEEGGSVTGTASNGQQVTALALPGRDVFTLTTARSKSSGGEFFLNRDLQKAMGAQFVSRSNGMVSNGYMRNMLPALKVMMEGGVKFELSPRTEASIKDRARKMIEASSTRQRAADEAAQKNAEAAKIARPAPAALEEPVQPSRTMTQAQEAELSARQQQGMARRGGQEAISDQAGGLFSAERDQDTLFSRTSDSAASQNDAMADLATTMGQLKAQVKGLGLGDRVLIEAVDTLFNDPNTAGSYQAGVIRVALAAKQDPAYTLDHESIHAFRDLGLFRPSEWSALARAASGNKPLMESVRERYGDLNEDQQVEEGVAEMFAQWREGRRSHSGFVRAAFQRILDLFSAIRRAVRGASLQDEVRDIMRRIEEGKIGERDPDGPDDDGPGGGVRESRIAAASDLIGKSGDAFSEAADRLRAKMQDRMLPLLRTQARIELENGRPLSESMNPYLAEEGLTNKIGDRLDRLSDDLIAPLIDTMKADGITADELDSYLYARHAPERNERISSINPEFGEGSGSGMTDLEAASIMTEADARGKIPALERAAEKIDAILKFAIDTRVDAGLLSREEADAWGEQYQFYVPLRGFAEIEPESGDADRPRFGKGINVRGPESKRAFGRKSKATDIIAYSIMQAEEAIIRGERNEVAKTLYNLAKANPDPDFWKVNKVTRQPVFNKDTGRVSYRNQTQLSPQDEKFTVSLKIDGREQRVTFNQENAEAMRMVRAMRMVGQSDLGPLRYLAAFNRFQSAINTRWNPEFVITNGLRDMQSAAFNLNAAGQGKIAKAAAKDYKKAVAAAYRGSKKSGNAETNEWDRWYSEFAREGAVTSYNRMDDVVSIRDRINKRLKLPAGTPGQVAAKFQLVGKAVADLQENLNSGVENGLRLAVYKNAREQGMSRTDAASLARNVTVNFTRRGEWSTAMNSLYLFYNASVQGSARLAKALSTKRGRQMAVGIALASLALDLLNGFMSDDDDDGQSFYDKIPDFEKSRNLIIMLPGENGRYVKIPLAFGLNIFPSIGRAAGEIMRGRRAGDAAGNMMGTIFDAFNPVGGSNSLLNFAAPTIVDPFVDLSLNRNFADKPIYQEPNQYAPETADNTNYFPSTGEVWKTAAGTLNALTGGDEVLPGMIDVHPETLKYWFGTMTGGAGRFVDRMLDVPAKLATGEPLDANDIPLASKVLGSKPLWYDKAAMYARTDEIEQMAAFDKQYRQQGLDKQAETYEGSNKAALELLPAVKATKKAMAAIRKARHGIERAVNDGEMDDNAALAARAELSASEQEIVARFNKQYISVIDRPKGP